MRRSACMRGERRPRGGWGWCGLVHLAICLVCWCFNTCYFLGLYLIGSIHFGRISLYAHRCLRSDVVGLWTGAGLG